MKRVTVPFNMSWEKKRRKMKEAGFDLRSRVSAESRGDGTVTYSQSNLCRDIARLMIEQAAEYDVDKDVKSFLGKHHGRM